MRKRTSRVVTAALRAAAPWRSARLANLAFNAAATLARSLPAWRGSGGSTVRKMCAQSAGEAAGALSRRCISARHPPSRGGCCIGGIGCRQKSRSTKSADDTSDKHTAELGRALSGLLKDGENVKLAVAGELVGETAGKVLQPPELQHFGLRQLEVGELPAGVVLVGLGVEAEAVAAN
eukprot:scaffold19345_cov32-Prasinocladus_malaysianus.AAC.1